MLVEASSLGPLAFGGSGPQITCTLFGGIVAPQFAHEWHSNVHVLPPAKKLNLCQETEWKDKQLLP